MRKAGVEDYETFAREVLEIVRDRPISFEVFSDDFDEMERQALQIASWGENVYVKIPVTNTSGEPSADVVAPARRPRREGQRDGADDAGAGQRGRRAGSPAARRATSRSSPDGSPTPDAIRAAHDRSRSSVLRAHPNAELIWASPRELLNIVQADAIGCHIITVTHDLLKKLPSLVGKDLDEFSLDTVKMFYDDGQAAGYSLRTAARGAPLSYGTSRTSLICWSAALSR